MIYNDICNARQKHCINELLRIEYFVSGKKGIKLVVFQNSQNLWPAGPQPLSGPYTVHILIHIAGPK